MTSRMLKPPAIPEVIPPSIAPRKPRETYDALLGKPTTLEESGITGAGTLEGPLTLHDTGDAPLKLQRDESVAAVYSVIEVRRHGTVYGYVGLDANDHVVILAKNGTTVLAEFDTDASQGFSMQLLRDHAAAVVPFLAIKRQAVLAGYLGVDASDRLALIAADGTTVLAFLSGAGELDVLLQVRTPKLLDSTGTQVVTTRQAAVADAASSGASGDTSAGTGSNATSDPVPKADFDALVAVVNANASASNANGSAVNAVVASLNAAITELNALLARVRTHGLIAP